MDQIKKNKSLLFIIGFLLLTNIAMLIFFLQKSDDEPRAAQPGRFTTALKNEVGFSEEQMKEYQGSKDSHMRNFAPLVNNIKNAKMDFYALVYQSPLPDSLMSAGSDGIASSQKELDMQMLRYFAKIRRICKKEQLPKFDTAVKQLVVRMISRSDRKPKK